MYIRIWRQVNDAIENYPTSDDTKICVSRDSICREADVAEAETPLGANLYVQLVLSINQEVVS